MTNQNNAFPAAEQEVSAIMEQAQVFASAWAFFGGPFDQGDGKEQAEREEKKLREVVRDVLSKLRAPVSDSFESWWSSQDEGAIRFDLQQYPGDLKATLGNVWNAALASAPVAGEAQCSCPSGNGSLRYPCAVHPQASEAMRDADRPQASAPLLKAARRAVLALAAAAERDPVFQGDYDALSAALSGQPGAQKGCSDA